MKTGGMWKMYKITNRLTSVGNVIVGLILLWITGFCAVGQNAGDNAGKPAFSFGSFTSNLPVVVIDTQKKPVVDRNMIPCSVRVLPANKTNFAGVNPCFGSVRVHGATSSGYPKKSYRISLTNDTQFLDLRKNSQWILNAAFIDRSLMRHKLAYDLFMKMGTPERPRYAAGSRFVEVFLNDEYMGVYLFMEKVNRKLFNLIKFDTNNFSHSCIYKAVDHAANFDQTGANGYEQQEPEPEIFQYWKPLQELNTFISTSKKEDFFNSTNGIESQIDIENAIDFHLLVLLTSNSDGITKNYFLARNGQKEPPQREKFFFAPWDYDGSFGRNWDGNRYPHDAWLSNRLFDRLNESKEYRKRFAARYNELRKTVFSEESLFGMIDENVRTLGDAVKRNAERWKNAINYYPDRTTFDEDISYMKEWLRKRLKWLDDEINRRANN